MVSNNICSKVLFSKNPHHTETIQVICLANQLTGFFTIRVLTEKYSRTDLKLLLPVMSYSQMTYKCNYNGFCISE